jgi:hypothetical protein
VIARVEFEGVESETDQDARQSKKARVDGE